MTQPICASCVKQKGCSWENNNIAECSDFMKISYKRIIKNTKVQCRKCYAHIIIKNKTLGEEIKCPECGKQYTIGQEVKLKTIIEPVGGI